MRIVVVTLAVLPLLVAPASSRADEAADRATIIAGEKAWGTSFVTADIATIERLVDDGFMATDTDGSRYTKGDMKRWQRNGPVISANTTTVTAVRFWGDTAIVQGRDEIVGPAPAHTPGARIWTDTWMKRTGRWRIIASQDNRPPAP